MKQNTGNRWLGELSDEQTAQLWARVAKRLKKPAGRDDSFFRGFLGPRTWALSFAVLASTGLVAVWLVPNSTRPDLAILATESDPLALTLEEGTRLRLSPHSEVNVTSSAPEKVSLALGRGLIECDVVPNPKRRFSVFAGDFEVRVVGTKFQVQREVNEHGARVDVDVERGVVEVRRSGQEERVYVVRAGQKWSSEERLVAPSPLATNPAPTVEEPSTPPVQAEPKVSPSDVRASGAEGRTAETEVRTVDLFEQARGARQSGDPSRAVQLYEQFLKERPKDGRRGLAAFEIARLEMDALQNPRKALISLDRALQLGGGRYREDIMARKIRAQDALGQTATCRTTREAYLKQYPEGIHRMEVLRQCP
jgi:hypothetical protein